MLNKSTIDLSKLGPSLCLAKWLHLSLHLERGTGHSCHHPSEKMISTEQILELPQKLHNTNDKILERKQMISGVRPPGCEFCWRAEDALQGHLFQTELASDRLLKSSENWAAPFLNDILENPNLEPNPTYLEVSFSNTCQLKCSYCGPHNSSSWQNEIGRLGNYTNRVFPKVSKNFDDGPFKLAFWNWWPSLSQSLMVLRITGGEPLLSSNTWRLFRELQKNPKPNLELIINTNLSVNLESIGELAQRAKDLLQSRSIKSFKIITSMEAVGKAAEYIRFGLNSELFWSNLKYLAEQLPQQEISITSTIQIMSADSFLQFVDTLLAFRETHSFSNLGFDPTPIKHPDFMCIEYLPEEEKTVFLHSLQNALVTCESRLSSYEKLRLQSIVSILKICVSPNESARKIKAAHSYFRSLDGARNTNFFEVFPRLGVYA